MRKIFFLTIFFLIFINIFAIYDQSWLDINDFHIMVTNFGVIGMDVFSGSVAGAYWPAGFPNETYFWGSGIWFGALVDSLTDSNNLITDTLVSFGYDPSHSLTEFIPGVVGISEDPSVRVYLSTSDNDGYGWPIKDRYNRDSILSDQDSYCWYSDKDPNHQEFSPFKSIGIEVFQYSYAWTADSLKDIVIFKFEIVNLRDDRKKIRNCYFSISADPDIANDSETSTNELLGFIDTMTVRNNRTGISELVRMNTVYQFQLDSEIGWHSNPGIPSLVLISTPKAESDIDLYGDGGLIINKYEEIGLTSFTPLKSYYDPNSTTAQYLVMSGHNFKTFNPTNPDLSYESFPKWGKGVVGYPGKTERPEEEGDKRFVISTGPFDLDYNEKAVFAVAYVINPTPDDIVKNTLKLFKLFKNSDYSSIDEKKRVLMEKNKFSFYLTKDVFGNEIDLYLTNSDMNNVDIDILDIQGKKVLQVYKGILFKNKNIKVKHNLSSGVYFVRCIYGDKNIVKKIKILK